MFAEQYFLVYFGFSGLLRNTLQAQLPFPNIFYTNQFLLRRDFMRKEKVLIATTVAVCALAFAGCKKREAIDLSSLHTTVAVEKESIPETTEPAATEPSEESNSGSSQKGNTFSLKTELKTETAGNATIEYPVVSSMKDSEKQKQVNALLRSNAMAIADVHPDQTLSVKATVEAANLKRIVVSYHGELKNPSTSKTERLFYTNTIDLEAVKNMQLGDFADAYTLAGYITSGDYKLESVSGNEQSVRSYINSSEKTTDYYYNKLKAADFSGGYTSDENATPASDWPEVFSYEKQGVVYVSLPLPSELGNYAIIRYSPDNK